MKTAEVRRTRAPAVFRRLFQVLSSLFPALIGRTEKLNLLNGLCNNRLSAVLQEFARIKALLSLMLFRLNVGSSRITEGHLKLGVYVNLGDTKVDSFLNLVVGNARAAVENEGQVARLCLMASRTSKRRPSQFAG